LTQKAACFPPQVRLREPAEFKRVFAKAERSSDKYFTVLAIVNELDYPRLGLAIAKKISNVLLIEIKSNDLPVKALGYNSMTYRI